MDDPVTWLWYKLAQGGFHVGGEIGGGLKRAIEALWRAKNASPRTTHAEKIAIRKNDDEVTRLAKCRQMVLQLREDLGYIAAEAISMEEVNAKIKAGITDEELAVLILSRIDKVPGITLGKRHFQNMTYDMKLPYSLRDKHVYIAAVQEEGKLSLSAR
jgi:hypothetical protein